MSALAPTRRLYVPGSRELWPWWVGPDPQGRWHVALAPEKPHEDARTTAAAVCGLKPTQPYTTRLRGGATWMSWKHQQVQPAPGAACCADCLYEAQRHDWPRSAGLVAFEQPPAARTERGRAR